MKTKTISTITIIIITLLSTLISTVSAAQGGRPQSPIRIYVENQELVYESIGGPALPWKPQIMDTFQELWGTPPDDLYTDFGPGDVGYKGGRWWIDSNEPFGEQDAGDTYFVCPLLGPGVPVV